MALSLIANSLLSVSLFQKPIASDELQFAPRLDGERCSRTGPNGAPSKGLSIPIFLTGCRRLSMPGDGGRSPSPLRWKNFDPGLTRSDGDLVISQDQLYKLGNARFRSDSTLARGNYDRIFVCNQAIVPSTTGWRVLQSPPIYVNFDDDQSTFRCWLEDPTNRRMTRRPFS